MSHFRLPTERRFSPEAMAAMQRAFAIALDAALVLGEAYGTREEKRDLINKAIVALAQEGELSVARLSDVAVMSVIRAGREKLGKPLGRPFRNGGQLILFVLFSLDLLFARLLNSA